MSHHVHLIQKNEIPKLQAKKIFVTNQTTMSILELQDLFHKIEEIYPQAEFHDEICNATRIRQQAVLNLKDQNYDALIVVGDPTSNNTQKLLEAGKNANIPIRLKIQDVNELKEEDLAQAKKIAVTSGASTPTFLTEQVITQLHNQSFIVQDIPIDKIL